MASVESFSISFVTVNKLSRKLGLKVSIGHCPRLRPKPVLLFFNLCKIIWIFASFYVVFKVLKLKSCADDLSFCCSRFLNHKASISNTFTLISFLAVRKLWNLPPPPWHLMQEINGLFQLFLMQFFLLLAFCSTFAHNLHLAQNPTLWKLCKNFLLVLILVFLECGLCFNADRYQGVDSLNTRAK